MPSPSLEQTGKQSMRSRRMESELIWPKLQRCRVTLFFGLLKSDEKLQFVRSENPFFGLYINFGREIIPHQKSCLSRWVRTFVALTYT